MPLTVISCCTYLTEVGAGWRPGDYDAHDFVWAVKGRSINKYAQIPVRGAVWRLDDANRDRALVWFAQMIADAAPRHGLAAQVALVPVPNSRCDLASEDPPRTLAQARALAVELDTLMTGDAVVLDLFRWSERVSSASSSAGTRDPQELFDRLRLVTRPPPLRGRRIVLVDDVLTSGGHLQACAAIIRDQGYTVHAAVVAGRSDRAQVDAPFALRIDEIADFTSRARRDRR